mgnify:CR=1 FL=1
MPIRIGGDSYLVPAPLVGFQKEFITAGNGEVVGNNFTFTLNGVLLPNKGNPIATGDPVTSSFSSAPWTTTQDPCDDPSHNMTDDQLVVAMMAKQEELRRVFSGNAVQVEILGYNSSQGIKFVGDVLDISFAEDGRWILPCAYTVTLRTSNFIESVEAGLFSNGSSENAHTYYVSAADETWSLQESDTPVLSTGDFGTLSRTFDVTHNLSAVGQRVYASGGLFLNGLEPWQQASGYVRSTIGLGFSNFPSGLLNPQGNYGYNVANRTFTEDIDKRGGGYSVTETFTVFDSGLLPSGAQALETIDLTVDRNENGITSVTINGNINGLNTIDPTSTTNSGINKYPNATGYFNTVEPLIYERARRGSALSWLNPMPRTKGVSRNPNAGTVGYSYVYTDSLPNLIPGSISEDIQVNDTYPGQIYATIPVIGRNQAILQYVNSRTSYQRTLQINVTMSGITQNWTNGDINGSGVWAGFTAANVRSWLISEKPSVTRAAEFNGIYEAANPANEASVNALKVYYDQPNETWNAHSRNYSFSVSWTYERNN